MKISNEQLRVLQETELKKTQQPKGVEGDFGALLSRTLGQQESAETQALGNRPVATEVLGFQLTGVQETAPVDFSAVSNEAATRMDGMFTEFEQYAKQLASGGQGNLREAYGYLESVNQQIAGFKADYPNAGKEMPGLASLLNELDVLSTTETFKFNRGDYL